MAYEEYNPFLQAFSSYGLDLALIDTGGGCVALWIQDTNGNDIFTLGPMIDDRFMGFEVSTPEGGVIAMYKPVDDRERDADKSAALIAPAIKRYLSGEYMPLPDWTMTSFVEREGITHPERKDIVRMPDKVWYDAVSMVRGESLEELEQKLNTRLYELNKTGCHVHEFYESPLSEYTMMIWYSYAFTD